jgi:hypothetical protein
MYVFLSKIYTAVLVLLLVSCKTIDYNYSLIAKYIVLPDTKEKNKIEVLEGINEFLVSHGFITNLSFNNLTIETEWQQASTTANDAMNIIKQTNNLTTGNHNPNNNQYTTQIKYYLPQGVKTAYLCIYNLQGAQIKQILITQRGEGLQLISGSELTAGMYLYALICEGKLVDTKQMILTK